MTGYDKLREQIIGELKRIIPLIPITIHAHLTVLDVMLEAITAAGIPIEDLANGTQTEEDQRNAE